MYCYNSSPAISNGTIVGNTASATGGGMYNYSGSGNPRVVNCTFSGNSAPTGAGLGSFYGSPSLANCVLWANSGLLIYHTGGTPDLSYCDVQGGWTGMGNIKLDPKFVRNPSPGPDGVWGTLDDDYGDLRLQAGSPCIDAGNNAAAVAAGLLTDLDGHLRFFDDPATPDCRWAPGTCGTPPIVDMSAYEFIPVIPGDFDRDGDVDLADLAAFQACFSGPGAAYTGDCAKADLNVDGAVDMNDFGIFQRCFSGVGKPVNPDCAK